MVGIIVGVGLASAVASGLVVHTLHTNADAKSEAAAVAAAADVAEATGQSNVGVSEATGDAVEAGIQAATAEDTTDAQTRQQIAQSEPATIAMRAAVEVLSPRSIGALAGYSTCIVGSQGKQEGSAAYGCTQRGTALDAALAAEPIPVEPSCPEPAEEPEPPAEPAVP